MIGAGTLVNVVAVLAGASIGMLAGGRLPVRTRDTVTDALGLVTLLIAGLSAVAVTDPALSAAVGDDAPVLIVLGACALGGIVGSLIGIERGLERLGATLQRQTVGRTVGRTRPADPSGPADPASGVAATAARERFVEGFVTASLVFCVGPLTIVGAIQDGLGNGAQELYLKSVLDFFAAMAFAASFGVGVAMSALTVLVVQGALTVVGAALGDVVPEAHLVALTATGGILLAGVGLRLLRLRSVAVADLLPALVIAPLLVQCIVALR